MATATTPTYPLSLHDALPISRVAALLRRRLRGPDRARRPARAMSASPPPLKIPMPLRVPRSEEHTSELQSLTNLVCRLLLEKKKALPDGEPRIEALALPFPYT